MKIWRRLVGFAVLLFSCFVSVGGAQVAPPKRESHFSHLFGSHREGEDLERRHTALSCALVIIQAGDSLGTGFFVSADGDVVTASHVLGERIYQPEGERMRISLRTPVEIIIRTSTEQFTVAAAQLQVNADQWGADVAVLRTGRRVTCWLSIADDNRVRTGQHVISLGFPGLAFGSLSLYSGIVSARLRSGLVVGRTVQGLPLTANNDVFRVQMPISPGISGAPVIDDENRAIAVVTAAGAWSPDLETLIRLVRTGTIRASAAPNTIDLPFAIGQLATIFHDFASPGYGDAVPVSYLGRPAAQQGRRPVARGR